MATGNIVVSPNNSTSLYQGSAQPNVVVQVSNTNPTSAIIPQNNSSGLYNASGLILTPQSDIIGNNVYASGNIEALGYISAIGNVYGDYIYGNGAFLSYVNGANIIGGYGNAQVAAYLQVYNGNITAYNISTFGNITSSANVNGNNLNGNTLTVNTTATFGNIHFPNGTSIDQITGGIQISSNVSIVGNIISGNISTAGNITANNINALTSITIGNSSLSNGNLTVGNISVSGNIYGNGMLLTGDANILGNLNVQGNVTFNDIDVIVTNDLYIQLANNRTTYANINNAGLVVGPVSAPLTNWQYKTAANSWTTNVSISASGSVRGNNVYAANIVSGPLLLNTGNIVRLNGDTTSGNTSGNTVSIGLNAGDVGQQDSAIAIGRFAANNAQGANSIAIGRGAGLDTQGSNAIAIGFNSANSNQGAHAIAIGFFSGNSDQGSNTVAIGRGAGQTSQGDAGIAIGQLAGQISQSANSIAIGRLAGNSSQGDSGIAIGRNSANLSQGANSIAIGRSAAQTNQGIEAIAIGHLAGNNSQGNGAIAIGYGAGNASQAANSIVITAGGNLTSINQGLYINPVRSDNANVTFGVYYNNTTKELTYATSGGVSTDWANIGNITNQYGPTKIAIGKDIGTATGNESIAIGNSVWGGIGLSSIAIGANAATQNGSDYIIAIGDGAGRAALGQPIGGNSIAIGRNAGRQVTQGNNSIAIGFYSQSRYSNSIAIGTYATAGYDGVGYNTIVLNASGNSLVGNTANSSLYIDPIRNSIATNSVSQVVCYNTTTKEVTYSNRLDIASILVGNLSTTGNISAAGNITAGNLNITGTFSTTGNLVGGNIRTTGTITATGNIIGSTILATNNISAGGNVIGDYFLGNIFAASIIGNVNYANTAGTVLTNAQPNITSVGTLTSLSVTGNIASGNLSAVSNITAVNFISTGFDTQANVGNVYTGNLILSTFSSNAGPKTGNLESGNIINEFTTKTYDLRVDNSTVLYNTVTITDLTGPANLLVNGTISATGNITGNYFIGNGSQLTGIVANISYSNSNVASYLQVLTSNISTTGNVTANYFIGNGSQLTSLTGANVTGTVANATYAVSAGTATTAGTVTTNAQPNITSVGTLTTLSVTGNVSAGNVLFDGGRISGVGNINGGNIIATYLWGNGSNITGVTADTATSLAIEVKNTSGGSLTKGTPVYATGTVGATDVLEVSAARADTLATMPAVGLLTSTLANNAVGFAMSVGTLTAVDTSLYAAGQDLYVAATGGITGTRPTGTNVVQPIGAVARVSSTTGSIDTNIWNYLQLPNLGSGNIWQGNAAGYPTEVTAYGNSNVESYLQVLTSNVSTTGNIWTSNLYASANISATGNVFGLDLTTTNGDGDLFYTKPQITMGFGTIAEYPAWIHTRHNTSATNNAIDFYTSNGTSAAVFPTDGVLGLTINNGNVGIGGIAEPGNTLDVNGNVYTSGNVVAAYLYGDGSNITGLASSYGNSNVATFLADFGSNVISTSGTVTTPTVSIGGVGSLALGAPGEVDLRANAASGSSGIFMNNNAATTVYGNTDVVLQTNTGVSPVYFTFDSAGIFLAPGNISAVGNIIGSYLYGDGSNITGLPASYGNANVDSHLADFGSNTISTTGNITASYFIGNGSQLTGITTSYGNANVAAFLPTYTGNLGNTGNSVSVQLVNYKDVVFTGGNATGTITPDAASGSIYKYTLTGNITLNGFGGTPQAGQHIIIVLTQDATGNRLLTSTMKWAGGFKTLSTAANAVDIATVWYDGSTYYGALTRGYS